MEELKANCNVVDGDDMKEHWVWRGTTRGGRAHVWAPNFTADATGATMTAQTGARAVLHIKTGAPIAHGHRAFMRCAVALCVNPECVRCGTAVQHGRSIKQSGRHRGLASKIAAGRRNCATQRKVDEVLELEILNSNETNKDLALRLNLHRDTIANVRCGRLAAHSNPFRGLLR